MGDLELLKKRLNIIRKQKESILSEEVRLIRLIKQQEKLIGGIKVGKGNKKLV